MSFFISINVGKFLNRGGVSITGLFPHSVSKIHPHVVRHACGIVPHLQVFLTCDEAIEMSAYVIWIHDIMFALWSVHMYECEINCVYVSNKYSYLNLYLHIGTYVYINVSVYFIFTTYRWRIEAFWLYIHTSNKTTN